MFFVLRPSVAVYMLPGFHIRVAGNLNHNRRAEIGYDRQRNDGEADERRIERQDLTLGGCCWDLK